MLASVLSSGSSTDEGRIVTIAFPGESADYRAARDRLLEQEIELRRATEAVAVSRRALPPGGPVPEDYVFQGAGMDGAPLNVKLSQLFEPGKNSLVIYSFMFPRDPGDTSPGPVTGETALLPLQEGPCPSCTALLDQLDGAVEHAEQHINFAVVAKTRSPACSPSLRSADGVAYVSCHRPPTRVTATTTEKPPRDSSGRCSMCSTATGTRSATSGAQSFSTPRRTPIRNRVTSARSSRSGISSISPSKDARATGTSSCATNGHLQRRTGALAHAAQESSPARGRVNWASPGGGAGSRGGTPGLGYWSSGGGEDGGSHRRLDLFERASRRNATWPLRRSKRS